MPFVAYWRGRIPAGTVRHQLIGTFDFVPTFVELAGGRREPEQMLDSVSLVPVLLGQRGDDQPVRSTLLIQSSPGRDAFTERAPEVAAATPKSARKKMKGYEKEAARNKAWNQAAKQGNASGSDGMAHALREGTWKLVLDIARDKPAALYDLATDLREQRNLIADPAQAARVQRMETLYREFRTSKRSTAP